MLLQTEKAYKVQIGSFTGFLPKQAAIYHADTNEFSIAGWLISKNSDLKAAVNG